jgi:hypothetical protein
MKIRIYIEYDIQNSLYIHKYFTNSICEITENISDCNYILSSKIPWGNCDPIYIQNVLNSYHNITKKVLIFLISDTCLSFNIPNNVLLFRTSIQKSLHTKNEFILPYIWEGIEENYDTLTKTEKPFVGFCGLNNMHRYELLNELYNNSYIQTNFIIRDQFWGGNPHFPPLIKEFQENIINNHFTVCNRGAGNFSMRFYQVLSIGRIPILIDTDMIFPFEKEIPWDNIIIRGKNSSEVIHKLFDFWYKKDIISIQNQCKYIYDTYFSPLSFCKILMNKMEIDDLSSF